MKRYVMLFVAAMLLLAVAVAEAKTGDGCIKWSQLPAMIEPWGMDIESDWDSEDDLPNVIVMDDWMCMDGMPISDVHWWGSYLIAAAAPALGFRVSIHADIPAEPTGLPSHPGELLAQWTFSPTEVFMNFHGLDIYLNEVYQYFVYLPEYFYQERDKIYWLDIQAIVPGAVGPVWGWHTAMNQPHNIDDAVQIFDYDHVTGTYTQWAPLKYEIATGQFISLDMAFELTTIPEPYTILMMGGGIAGLAAIVRKRIR